MAFHHFILANKRFQDLSFIILDVLSSVSNVFCHQWQNDHCLGRQNRQKQMERGSHYCEIPQTSRPIFGKGVLPIVPQHWTMSLYKVSAFFVNSNRHWLANLTLMNITFLVALSVHHGQSMLVPYRWCLWQSPASQTAVTVSRLSIQQTPGQHPEIQAETQYFNQLAT